MMTDPFAQQVDPFNQRKIIDSFRKQFDEETKGLVVTVFATPHGLQLLDRWEDLHLRQSVCPIGAPEGTGYARSAVNDFIVKIRRIINEAQKPGAL